MYFPAKINIIFGISASNNVGISKIYAEKQVALHSLTFTAERAAGKITTPTNPTVRPPSATINGSPYFLEFSRLST